MRFPFSKPAPKLALHLPEPSAIPQLQGATISAAYYGERIGGDFYDFIRVSPSRVLFGLLDVAGAHEESQGIVARAQQTFRGQALDLFHREDVNQADALVELVLRINRAIMEAAGGVRPCPAFAGCYNEGLGTVCYSNAGHTPALLRDHTGITRLDATGLPLGLFSHATHDAPTCALEPGAALLLVSRGVTEGRCKGDEFGLDGVEASFRKVPLTNAQRLCVAILDGVERFMCAPPTHNDVTALALIRTATP
jgi:sigma-B regulation protein RsbU (phosphoserine phosphatase)